MKKVPEEKLFSENLGESLKRSSEKREDDWIDKKSPKEPAAWIFRLVCSVVCRSFIK